MATTKRTVSPQAASVAAVAEPSMAVSCTAARLACGAAILFLVLLAALHVIKPEYDPSWRMISEYAIGRNGWIMTLAFLALAVSYASLAVAIRSQLHTIGGKIGLALLMIGALGTFISAIFTTDPVTARPDAITTSGMLHGLGFLSVITFPIAATLLSRSLARNQAWFSARRSLALAAGFVWLGLLTFVVSMAIMFRGTFGPNVMIGWQNRLLIFTYVVWVMVTAWHMARLSTSAHHCKESFDGSETHRSGQ